ncbi:MAG: hypothetical protein HY433_02480 [Candidatus Liptonbacteria bacterium]|nr:hypothetical protein [Candidatus Liptonbacteria bacterium]
MTTNGKKLFLAITALLIVCISVVVLWILVGQKLQKPVLQSQSLLPAATSSSLPSAPTLPVAPLVSLVKASSTAGTKTYRNTEYGFEFQYPESWKFEENKVYSPFSKFNLIGSPVEGIYISDPIVINVVTPDFAERQFSDLKGTGLTTNIAGVVGERYNYTFEGTEESDIILPFASYKMILGVKKPYEDIFNQILASFKFLRN